MGWARGLALAVCVSRGATDLRRAVMHLQLPCAQEREEPLCREADPLFPGAALAPCSSLSLLVPQETGSGWLTAGCVH